MSKTTIDEIPSPNDLLTETDHIVQESVAKNEDEETWLYEHNKSKSDENIDNTTAPSIDEITTQEINAREKAAATLTTTTTSLVDNQLDDDSEDDDGIQVTIGDYEPEITNFQTNRPKPRGMLSGTSAAIPPKPSIIRGVDLDAQGFINGQPTYEHDIMNAYKDEEKPWKKPGADITEYFNYGFTEETWVQYCDRQRRLRNENNLARHNTTHISPMLPGHPPIIHPINSHPIMMINKSMNMPMISRPMNIRKPDGKIDVIGATDHTSRRSMFEASNNFEHPQFLNGLQFLTGQPPSGQTVGDLISTPSTSNGPPPPGNTHHIPSLGMNRLPMISLPPGIPFRVPFGHLHAPGGPQFFPRGSSAGGMHGDRLPQPYFIPHRAPQPWDKTSVPPVHNFPPGPFPPQITVSVTNNNGRVAPSSRSPTPENRSSHSSTPEETRTSNTVDNDKSSKDDRYKERYRDDREYHLTSRHRSSSSSYHSRHRIDEYERPKNDRKSSRDRDDKYEHHSRKRQHRDDSNRHHRIDDESSRNYRSSRRTPTKTSSSPSKINTTVSIPSESSQILNEQTSESDQVTSSSSPANRSRHIHHKKSSKRSRHDSDDERNSNHHRRRSKDRSKSNSKKSTNQNESLSDVKEQNNE
ncbi:unnamed protein product [Rotaria sp. Silwood1]|nr:unnamed protein product [Rotaria sp. Silwood1]CAF1542691.1 unnamed protein product [Rotaria sp. Silwood1]CAF3704294.1 unnamed protein product [Rotaria sp. Silwood1]CAF4806511.1 unnamed protein product [Rotaria sp. Silwood1]